MTVAQWIGYVILPAAIALIGFVASRGVELHMRKNKQMRDAAAAHGLKAAE
jgi:hypothetical protein